jgi:F420-non-reducing hydrogenase iron-sulfur subunit
VRAERRVAYAKSLLEEIGLEPDRLEMRFVSSAMGREFAQLATDMTERIKELGPNPLRKGGATA